MVMIKRRIPRLLKDYTSFDLNSSNLDEAARILRHVEYSKEFPFLDSPELKSSVCKLKIFIHPPQESSSSNRKRGRPPSIVPNGYLPMLVWYRYVFQKHRKLKGIKDISIYEEIAESINIDDIESCRAAVLDGDLNAIRYMDSEASVKRAIRRFRRDGFIVGDKGIRLHNEIQVTTFCVIVLKLDNAENHVHEIIYCWNKQYNKSQDQ